MKRAGLALALVAISTALGVGLAIERESGLPPALQREGVVDSSRDLEALREATRVTDVDRAIDRGLEYLLSAQNTDGSFGSGKKNALTSLAIMAFLSRGQFPDDESPAGRALSRGVEFLLDDRRAQDDGFFGVDGSRMYGHVITLLALAEVHGQAASDEQDARVGALLARGVEALLRSQNVPKPPKHAGGWRYELESSDSDLSVTVWAAMALRAAQNAGLELERGPIDRAIAYMRKCFDRERGSLAYQPGRNAELPISAAGVLGLSVCGEYSGREIRSSADWLLRATESWRVRGWQRSWFFYGTYYFAQAMHQLGGEYATRGGEIVEHLLLRASGSKQSRDGSWPPPPRSSEEIEAGAVYRTAMAILALAVEDRVLPIYQR